MITGILVTGECPEMGKEQKSEHANASIRVCGGTKHYQNDDDVCTL